MVGMIRVMAASEPESFQKSVREPGEAFLNSTGIGKFDSVPEKFPWKTLWKISYDELYLSYNGVCAYLGIRFPKSAMETDHFLPKKNHPWLAYSWSNFRLCYHPFNTTKGHSKPIFDPFEVESEWFDIDIWTGLVTRTNAAIGLSEGDSKKLDATIEKLNQNDYPQIRLERIDGWILDEFNLDSFAKWAPFIREVILRQGFATH